MSELRRVRPCAFTGAQACGTLLSGLCNGGRKTMQIARSLSRALAGCVLLLAGSAHAITLNFEEALYDNFVSLSGGDVTFTANPAGFGDYGSGFWTGADFVAGGALEVAPSGDV